MGNQYSRKIACILEEGKKCKEKLSFAGPTGPIGPTGATGPTGPTARYNKSSI